MSATTESIVSIANADEDFSKDTRVDFNAAEEKTVASNEEVMEVSRRLIQKNREAYKTLA